MAPTPFEHAEPPRTRAGMLASTAMPRVGFGLSERAPGDRPAALPGPPASALAQASLTIEGGLLMAFGPEGDPIPPAAFIAAAAGQPDAEVALTGGGAVPAIQAAAVLEAQARGPLATEGDPAGSEAWIKAMLGLGPRPDPAGAADLRAERAHELTAFGQELMLGLPGGRAFVIDDAATPRQSAATAGLLLADGQALSVGDLVARLRDHAEQLPRAAAMAAGARDRCAEIDLPGCGVRSTTDGLLLELPAVGDVRLAKLGSDAPAGPRVGIFTAEGVPADLDDLLAALGAPAKPAPPDPDDRAAGPAEPDGLAAGPAEPAIDAADPAEPDGLAAGPAEPAIDADAAGRRFRAASAAAAIPPMPAASVRSVPVRVRAPAVDGVDPGRVTLLIVGGLPEGAALSPGIDDGGGRWLLSPRHLGGLRLTAPPGWAADLPVEVTAVAVRNRAGELATATDRQVLALEPAAPAPLPLRFDPAALRDGGPALNALVVRGVPAGAELSVGTFDPAIDGWVLLPGQLAGLAIRPPAGAVDLTLTLLGISMAAGGRAQARVLTRLAVARA